MIFDGIITKTIVTELNSVLIGGKIEKVTQPNKLEINLHIYNKEKYILCLNANASENSIHLTKESKANPITAPLFCMVLRKHIQSSKILQISQYMSDRIIQIDFETYNEMNDKETKKIIIELMGKHSNIILIDNQNDIIDSIKHVDASVSSVRCVLPNFKYQYPITKLDFSTTSSTDFYNILAASNNIVEALTTNFNGFSTHFVKEILTYLNINNEDKITLDISNLIFNHIKKIYESINLNTLDVDFENTYINISNDKSKENPIALNLTINNYFSNKNKTIKFNEVKNELLKVINTNLSKINKNLKIIDKNLQECDKSEKYKIYGELINANLYKIPNSNVKSIELENYYDNNNNILIPLDETISPIKNAQKFFKKYNKLKTTYDYSINQKELLNSESEYLDSLVYTIESATIMDELLSIKQELVNQKYMKEKSKKPVKVTTQFVITKYLYNGFEIYVGKNNMQNEYLTHKFASNNDLWFHAQHIQGSHVVIKNTNAITEDIIEFAAQLAGYYSKGKNNSKLSIDYCYIRNVKKHSFNKPGLVTYSDFKTVYTSPHKHENYLA